ncbi:hypothetical protein [Halobellus clavatus]|uniref:ABC-2 type transport system permease protein n=1 Tax=Halobellus clavatus TaxID=660517 RepID=A0A1H3FLR9_9EURY|nr:hypothetical protein [Halobellus clavatus]SDX91298.1 hypothetical protein SAMN04487946_1044 [Halobellus clavatus]
MSAGGDLRHGLRIARAELSRSIRGYGRDWRRLVGIAFAVLFLGGYLLVSLPAAYAVGRRTGSIEAIPFLGAGTSLLPVGLVGLAALRTLERIGRPPAEDLLLLTTHPRAVVLGLIGAELGRLAVWFGVPIVALVTAFGFGLGAPTVIPALGLVALPLFACSAVWGYTLGIGLLRAFRRLPTIRRLLKIGGIGGFVVLTFGSQLAGGLIAERSIQASGLLDAVSIRPLVSYVSLAFVGTPLADSVSLAGLGVLAALIALTPVGVVAATQQASALWFTDTSVTAEPSETKTGGERLAAPRPFSVVKSGRIAWGHLLRAVRKPQEFTHLILLVFFLGPVGTTVVQAADDALGPLVAGIGVGLGTYLAGATFGLNPLGDDRPHLPFLLLSGTGVRTIVRGRALAGVALGLPVAAALPAASVVLGTHLLHAAVFAAVGAGTVVAAAAFGLGLGAAYPIYEEREFWGTETVVPSTLVMLVFLAIVGGGTLIALLGTWVTLTGGLGLSPLVVGAAVVYLALTAGGPYLSYRYAVRRYRRYHLE